MSYNIKQHLDANEFIMDTVGQITSDKLRVPSVNERLLRAKLIYEEALETIDALGVYLSREGNLEDNGEEQYNPKEVLDGVCDLAVVANGTLLTCGLHTVFEEALERVDENNKTKVGPGFTIREDGKYQKPPGYKPVVLDDLIEKCK